jgi:putative PIN family toxin of toxin-antitoxin system
VLEFALSQGILLLSAPLAAEWTRNVVNRPDLDKYFPPKTRTKLLKALFEACEIVDLCNPVFDCEDPNDNHILDLGLSGKADSIITGNAKLLKLNPYRGISILNPTAFLATI